MCIRVCVAVSSRGLVVLVSRLVSTNPKPEQDLSVLTDADGQTEDIGKGSVSQSSILNSHRAGTRPFWGIFI